MSEFPVPRIDPARLARAVSRLPFVEREVFLMKARDRLSYAEIGAVLGLSPEAAEARMVAALVRLETRLTKDRPWWRRWYRSILRGWGV